MEFSGLELSGRQRERGLGVVCSDPKKRVVKDKKGVVKGTSGKGGYQNKKKSEKVQRKGRKERWKDNHSKLGEEKGCSSYPGWALLHKHHLSFQ